MSLRSREVWRYCAHALDALDVAETETQVNLAWFAAISMLRTSFEALNSVDRKSWPKLGPSIDAQWRELNQHREEHAIFFEFIKKERDLLVHEFDFSAEFTNQPLVVERNGIAIAPELQESEFHMDFFILEHGHFNGEDGRDIARDAHQWLNKRIAEIEAQL